MKQRDALLVLGAVVLATLVAAILFAGSLASASSADRGARRPGIFFDPRNSPPPIRTLVEEQRGAPIVLQPIVPLQRGLADTARDAAGYLLVLLGTSAALVLAREQVVSSYRASLGGWRTQLRVVGTGLAVIGVGASAGALAWIVFLGSLATVRAGPLGVPPGSGARITCEPGRPLRGQMGRNRSLPRPPGGAKPTPSLTSAAGLPTVLAAGPSCTAPACARQ